VKIARRYGHDRDEFSYAWCVLGLPDGTRGCLFDLDGVITKTAKVHNAAWKEMFGSHLRDRSRRTGEPFVPSGPVKDYDEYVDGKPRAGGARSFLASRDAGLRSAVVSSRANCRDVLAAVGIEDLFEARIDGLAAKRENLRGKPAPDTFRAGARAPGLEQQEAAVFEDAQAGVAACRAGGHS
jgi:beta-phosphoglucomutase-like phosphatase (HAD superfamily)